jgi:hypothetical protein
MIDHPLLKPEATRRQVEQLCAEAKQLGFTRDKPFGNPSLRFRARLKRGILKNPPITYYSLLPAFPHLSHIPYSSILCLTG